MFAVELNPPSYDLIVSSDSITVKPTYNINEPPNLFFLKDYTHIFEITLVNFWGISKNVK